MNCNHNSIRGILLLTVALSTVWPQPCRAGYESEVLLFPYLEANFLSGLPEDSGLDDDDHDFGLDLFAAIENRRFVFLAEALVSRDEQEIERLQVGWRIGESKAWLGRFHNPIGYWNTRFHHGDYLQTSITRPAIVDYEDDDGRLPMHLTGLLVEGLRERGTRGLGYALAIAAGPELGDHLEALDVLSPASGSQGLALTANVYHQPVAYGPNQYGLFASYTEIPASDRGIEEIRQFIAGGYWNRESDPWRMIGSIFYVRNRLYRADARAADDFLAGHIQVERALNDRWTLFGRMDNTFASRNDVYLALFPDHTRGKILAGFRIDIFNRHALKLEVSRNRGQDDHFQQFMLQWAAIY